MIFNNLTRRLRNFLLLGLLSFWLSGCDSSETPLYDIDESNVVIDDRFNGSWAVSIDGQTAELSITHIKGTKAYEISVSGDKVPDELSKIETRIVKIGEQKILDIIDPIFGKSDQHFFLRIDLRENKMILHGFNFEYLRKNPDLLKHKIHRFQLSMSGVPLPFKFGNTGMTITSSSSELQDFFEKHAEQEDIWIQDDESPQMIFMKN